MWARAPRSCGSAPNCVGIAAHGCPAERAPLLPVAARSVELCSTGQPRGGRPHVAAASSCTSERLAPTQPHFPARHLKRMRITVSKLTTIAFILLLLPTAALAQIPTRGNVFFGYSYGSADFSSAGRTNLNGWNGSLEGKVLPWVGFVADLS